MAEFNKERNPHIDLKESGKPISPTSDLLPLIIKLVEPHSPEGHPHINLDMTFTNLGSFDSQALRQDSFLVDLTRKYGFETSTFILDGRISTILNTCKSINGKSMELFTTTVTKHSQEFADKTDEKTGWKFFGKNKKEGITQ